MNPEIAVLQSQVSGAESLVSLDTANLQGAVNTLSSDTQCCNDPLDGGEIGLLPCSSQLEIDENAVAQDTQFLTSAQSALSGDQQELSDAESG